MTNAEARFNKSLRPRKPEGSLGRTAQDVHLDSHTAPELCLSEARLDKGLEAVGRRPMTLKYTEAVGRRPMTLKYTEVMCTVVRILT